MSVLALLLAASSWAADPLEAQRNALERDFGRAVAQAILDSGGYAENLRRARIASLSSPPDPPIIPPRERVTFNRDQASEDRELGFKNFVGERLDIHVLRLSPRLTLGPGYSERRVIERGRTLPGTSVQEYFGGLSFELARGERSRRRWILPPTATYSETEVSALRIRVQKDEYSIKKDKR